MCKCLVKVNKHLAHFNTVLLYNILDKPMTVTVATAKLNRAKRGKPVTMGATFCPFCGKNYKAKSILKPAKSGARLHGKPSKNPHIDPRENAFADNDSMGGETGRYLERTGEG